MKAIGYHTYAGGLAAGVAKHFELAGLGEHDGYGNAIKALNFPGVPLWASHSEWPRSRGRGKDAVPFIFSNPPCAIFSTASAGRAIHWTVDPRLKFWKDIIALVPEAGPNILALESVMPSWTKGREFIESLAKLASGWGYSVTALFHNAMYLGGAQNRKRVFYLLHNVDLTGWPAPPTFDRQLTVREVFKGVKIPAATRKRYEKEATLNTHRRAIYDATSPGLSLYRTFDKLNKDAERHADGRVKGRPGFLTRRLSFEEVGPVFMGSGHILHPSEPRSLYPEEINAYGSFPPDWRWPDYPLGKISTFASQGVSPKCGAWLAQGAKEAIERGKKVRRPDFAVMNGLSATEWGRGRVILSDRPDQLDVPVLDLTTPEPPPFEGGTSTKDREPREPRASRPGSGAYIREQLLAGKATDAIIKEVHEKFPGSKAGPSDIAWNRGKLRKDGHAI